MANSTERLRVFDAKGEHILVQATIPAWACTQQQHANQHISAHFLMIHAEAEFSGHCVARPLQSGWVFPLMVCSLPGNDVWQDFQNVGGQGAQIFGQAHKAWRQGDGLPMQQHLVGSANGGTHPSVGQPKACFGNLLHPFLQDVTQRCNAHCFLTVSMDVLKVTLIPELASPKPILATFFTPSYTQRTNLQSDSISQLSALPHVRYSTKEAVPMTVRCS